MAPLIWRTHRPKDFVRTEAGRADRMSNDQQVQERGFLSDRSPKKSFRGPVVTPGSRPGERDSGTGNERSGNAARHCKQQTHTESLSSRDGFDLRIRPPDRGDARASWLCLDGHATTLAPIANRVGAALSCDGRGCDATGRPVVDGVRKRFQPPPGLLVGVAGIARFPLLRRNARWCSCWSRPPAGTRSAAGPQEVEAPRAARRSGGAGDPRQQNRRPRLVPGSRPPPWTSSCGAFRWPWSSREIRTQSRDVSRAWPRRSAPPRSRSCGRCGPICSRPLVAPCRSGAIRRTPRGSGPATRPA